MTEPILANKSCGGSCDNNIDCKYNRNSRSVYFLQRYSRFLSRSSAKLFRFQTIQDKKTE